jgi:hypothetical protein
VCTPNAVTACYPGPAGTEGVGTCVAGTQTCNAQGTALGACEGAVTPAPQNCDTTADETCSGGAENAGCGAALWSYDFGTVNNEEGRGVAYDPATNDVILGGYIDGNVTFAGCGLVNGNMDDALFLAKFDASGNCLWANAWGDGASTKQLVTDASGNIYVTGQLHGATTQVTNLGGACGNLSPTGTEPSILVAKFTPSGSCLWSKSFGEATWFQFANQGVLDSADNLIIANEFAGTTDFGGGPLTSPGGAFDVYVAKFDTNGNYLWASNYGDSDFQGANSVAVDSANDIIVVGYEASTIDFGCGTLTSAGGDDAFVAKLGPTGTCLWSKRFGDAQYQEADGVVVDGAGNIYVVGEFAGTINLGGDTLTSLGSDDIFLAKLDPNGNHLWSESFGGPNNQNGALIAIDANDAVVITGQLFGSASFGTPGFPGPTLTSAGSSDVFIAKYDTNGNYLWSASYGDASTQSASQIAFDGAGNVLFVGVNLGNIEFGPGAMNGLLVGQGQEDIMVAKLAP